MEPFDHRDEVLDAFEAKLDDQLDFVFGAFLSGLSDDPRAIVFDILLLLMMGQMRLLIDTLPFRERAELAANLPPEDAPPGSTRGLDSALSSLVGMIESRVVALTALIASKAQEMAASGHSDGFVDVAQEIIDKAKERMAEDIATAMTMWERIVLNKIGDLMGSPVFVYAGPLDEKNRPFCRDIVSKKVAYTKSGINKLNAHPLLHSYVPPNVFTLCGGRNCRHVFLPISREAAVSQDLEIEE